MWSFSQLPEAVHLSASGGGGEVNGAAEGGSWEVPRSQTTGCRSDQTGAWKGRTGKCKEVRTCCVFVFVQFVAIRRVGHGPSQGSCYELHVVEDFCV